VCEGTEFNYAPPYAT